MHERLNSYNNVVSSTDLNDFLNRKNFRIKKEMLIYKYLVDQQINQPKGTSRFQTTQQDFTNWKHNLLNTTRLNVFWSDDRFSSFTLAFTLIFFFCLKPENQWINRESLAQGSSRPKVTNNFKTRSGARYSLCPPHSSGLESIYPTPQHSEDCAATRRVYAEQALWTEACALKGFCFLLLWW